LAALTTWYQGYYDIWLRGQYIWKIKDLHAQYGMSNQFQIQTALMLYVSGPIIRINPHEIHINDPAYIDEVYAGAPKKRDKYKWIARMVASKLIELSPAVSHI
jgi:hypothetical protein